MGHSHGSSADQHRSALVITLGLSLFILVIQVVGGIVSGSLALVADAGHTLTDVLGVSLALVAIAWAKRPPKPHQTFGRYRVEVLAAAGNGILLLAVCTYVLIESWIRWNEPHAIEPRLMLIVALAAVAANGVGMALLRRGAKESITVKGAYLEVLGDLLGSVGVVAAALIIMATGWDRADVVASVFIAALIIPRAIGLLREAWLVLGEGAPPGIDLDDVRRHMSEIPGVLDVHDLHAWIITSGMPVLSAHVVVSEEVLADHYGAQILDRLGECLHDCFDVAHCTFQLEPPGHQEHEAAAHP